METPGTSGGFNKLCDSTNNLEETMEEKEKDPVVSIMHKDESRLLNIFPEEIWREVLGKVDRDSLESVNNASPFFRRLLYPERQLFLFSAVWKILGVQYEVDSDPVYSDLELADGDLNDVSDDDLSSVSDGELNNARVADLNNASDDDLNNASEDDLNQSSDFDEPEKRKFAVILKLRLVCRDWCLGINKFYEDLYHNYDTQNSVLKPRVASGLDSADEVAINRKYGQDNMDQWSADKFKFSRRKLRIFRLHFEDTHDSTTNPFPFRKVIFHPHPQSDIINYLTEALFLVRKYGHHIWFCELYISNAFYIPDWDSDCYLKFQELLTLMPNLKVLQLVLSIDYFIRPIWATQPIPRLENLTYVSFKYASGCMMEHFLENNSQVTKIEILELNNFNFATVALPNLTHLAVFFRNMGEFEMFENCGRLWRLEMLHVTFAHWNTVSVNPLPRIFACLEQWKDSLTDVVVIFQHARRDEDKAEIVRNFRLRLDLPRVKRLRLGIRNIMSLDLILPMKKLELLEYSEKWPKKDWERIPKQLLDEMKTKEVIKFHSVPNSDMYNSNIWTLFPNLKRIHVDDFSNGPAYIREKMQTSEGQ